MRISCLLDEATGTLTLEGISSEALAALAGDILPKAREVNCGRPLWTEVLPVGAGRSGLTVRVAGIYHGSVVDGPGRRSVVLFQGCTRRCPDCYVPHTHDPNGGVLLGVDQAIELLTSDTGAPRDGVTVLGGEPFQQVDALAMLLRGLKERGFHTLVYTGYTLEELLSMQNERVVDALAATDMLIDGPFQPWLSEGAGPWRGSRNQRIVERPGLRVTGSDDSVLNIKL